MFLLEVRLSVSNGRFVEEVAPDDHPMQFATKTRYDDHFVFLNAQRFAGRNLRPVPFDNTE